MVISTTLTDPFFFRYEAHALSRTDTVFLDRPNNRCNGTETEELTDLEGCLKTYMEKQVNERCLCDHEHGAIGPRRWTLTLLGMPPSDI
jgi:hypothetical protein